MVELAAVSAAVGGAKSIYDMLKGMLASATDAKVKAATIELMEVVLTTQQNAFEASQTQAALLKQIDDLKKQIAGFEDWNREKERYQLTAIDSGAFAVTHKAGMEQGEAAVWFCQTCFENRHKSPLQFRAQDRGSGAAGGRGSHSRWGCNLCKAEVVVPYTRKPSGSSGI